jgi:hypothetical protein
MGKKGLQLDKVVLLGRTLDEYQRYFAFDARARLGQSVLDVASGVSSFAAEASALGLDVTALDPIYHLPPDAIEARCGPDLDAVTAAIWGLPVYRWDFYGDPQGMRKFREQAYRTFLQDFRAAGPKRYLPGSLPRLPLPARRFDLALVSYFLFVYEDHFSYDFHRDSILELMRVTHGEARLYPTVTFEGVKSQYLPRLARDPALQHLDFTEISTDFEFLVNSNSYLRIRHRPFT